MKFIRFFACAAMLLLLAACGGGGGSAGNTAVGGTNSSITSTSTNTITGGVTTPVKPTPTVSVSVVDAAGSVVSNVSSGGGFKAKAVVRDGAGVLVVGKLVTFSLNGSTIAVLTPLTALTNASGVAEVLIAPASISAIGAASLSATAAFADGETVDGKYDFAVTATNISLSPLTAPLTNLPSGGGVQISTTALLGGRAASGIAVNVVFSATCGKINGADAVAGGISVTTNGSGLATASYDAIAANGDLCSGPVTLSAISPGAANQTLNVVVAAPVANAIVFLSATPPRIFVAGSGAFEQSVVKFKVLSGVTSLAGVSVTFSIVTNPGGVGIGSSGSAANVVLTSNAIGEVSINVFSGTIPGPVKVKAALTSNPTVFVESQNLTVASGPPSQRFISLSASTFNIEGNELDGSLTKITARVADRQGNAVEDGTVVNFTAEAGQVAVSCATARVNGIAQCTVDYQSQNPRPIDGRITVMAHLSGTKDYVDVNGNNLYDPTVDNLLIIGNAFRDDNENNQFEPGEFFVPRGGTTACPVVGGAFPSVGNTCDNSLETTVRQQLILLNASTAPTFTINTFSNGGISIQLRSKAHPLLPMPQGTTVEAEVSGSLECFVDKIFGTPVPNVIPTPGNPGEDLSTKFDAIFKKCIPSDVVFLKVKAPTSGQLHIIGPLTMPTIPFKAPGF
jgi:hypothetical protein